MSWSATIPQTPARVAATTVDNALTEMVGHYDYGRAELDQINAAGAAWVSLAHLLFGDDELVAGSVSGHASDNTSQLSITLTRIQPVVDVPAQVVKQPVPMKPVADSPPAPSDAAYEQLAGDQSTGSTP